MQSGFPPTQIFETINLYLIRITIPLRPKNGISAAKYLLSVLLLCTSIICSGQNFKEQKPKQTIQANLINTDSQLSLDVVNGISMPSGAFQDFARDGFNSGIQISKSFCKRLSLGVGAQHSSFGMRQDFGPISNSSDRWTNTTIDIGPQFSFTSGKFAIKLYGRSGFSFINTPEIDLYYPNTDIITMQVQGRSTQALNTRLGGKLNAEICDGLQFFLSSEYVTTINSDLNYTTRNVSGGISTDGTIDPDRLNEIPVENKSLSFSSVNVNFGISIDLGSFGIKSGSAKKSNPLYKGNGNVGTNPIYDARSMYYDNSNSSGSRAQDYNSSRSNRTGRISSPNSNIDEKNDGSTKAQDYNSSRSNRTGRISSPDSIVVGKNDGSTKAQDYNSSRSNNSSSIDSDTKAQDYNSSRSNRTGRISSPDSIVDGKNDGSTKAQDYNSSSIDSNTKAQDYNSSRSNNSSSIANDPNDDIRQTMARADRAKLKRKMKRDARKKRKEARKKRKNHAGSLY